MHPCTLRTVDVVNDLVRERAVVLQDVVLLGARCLCHSLGKRQDVREVLVRQLVQLGRVILWDHERVALGRRADV